MEFKEIVTYYLETDPNLPFCVNSNDEFMMAKMKNQNYVYKIEYQQTPTQSIQFNLIGEKLKISESIATNKFQRNDKNIIESAEKTEMDDLFLDQRLLPDCSQPYIQSIKSAFSPYDQNNVVLMACLNSFGSLELMKYKVNIDEGKNWKKFVDLSDVLNSSLKLNKLEMVDNYNKLKRTINSILFENFDWSNKVISSTLRYLVTYTKSGDVYFFSIKNNPVTKEPEALLRLTESIVDFKISQVKWVSTKQHHYLFIATINGCLLRYSILLEWDGKLKGINMLSNTTGELLLPASNMIAEVQGENVLIVCSKAHSTEAFYFEGQQLPARSCKKYIGMNITGATSCGPLEYLFVSLDAKIYYLSFIIDKEELRVDKYTTVEYTSSEIVPSNYGAHGIACSKNKALFYIALHPRMAYDHLVMKQPSCLYINYFTKNDPYEIVIKNSNHQLTDFSDCLELIRYLGSVSVETLKPLEEMKYQVELSGKFLYYLKIQQLVENSKQTYYNRRSESISEVFAEKNNMVLKTIKVIRSFFLLKVLISKQEKEKLPEIVLKSAKLLRISLIQYLEDTFTAEPFKEAHSMFKNEFTSLIESSKFLEELPKEKCSFCMEEIENDKLVCKSNHQMRRCIITKLQLSLTSINVCKCLSGFIELETLKLVTINNKQFMLCPICDSLPFN